MMIFGLLSHAVHALLIASASICLVLCSLLLAECLLALLPPASGSKALERAKVAAPALSTCLSSAASAPAPQRWTQTAIAVLVPAHNEAAGITSTLEQISQQLKANDHLVVIADNCTDRTAAVARQSGAIVLERTHLARRGKGYALDHGLKFLSQDPPAVVVMIDADTQVAPNAIPALTEMTLRRHRPVQGAYTMTWPAGLSPEQVSVKDQITVFATTVKNVVRLRGLARLGLPVLLTGSGMAFPWPVLTAISVASGSLVEDMKMGLDLSLMGHDPTLCAEAKFTAPLPQVDDAAVGQRTRWEHGRFAITRDYVPQLLWAALKQRRLAPLVLALDLCILPLSLLVVVASMLEGISLLWAGVTGFQAAAWLGGGALLCLSLSIVISWLGFGRDYLPAKQLLLVPLFVLWKLPIYVQFLFNPQRQWVRTVRDPQAGAEKDGQLPAEAPVTSSSLVRSTVD